MKKLIPFLIFLFTAFSCEWFAEEEPYSIEYRSIFEMDTRPFALAVDDKSGELYVLSYKESFYSYCILEKYSGEGEFLETLVDFEIFNDGEFSSYTPADIFIEGKNIYVLARSENETYPKVFSVFKFSIDGEFLDEFVFNPEEGEGNGGACTMLNDVLYKVGNSFVKTYSLKGSQGKKYNVLISESENKPSHNISDIAVNTEGKIYLTGQYLFSFSDNEPYFYFSHHLTVYNPDTGELITTEIAGDENCVMGSMISQPHVEIGKHNRVYLTTFYCQELRIYEKTGKPIAELFLPDYSDERIFPYDVAVGNNRVYIADASEKKVLIFEEK